MLGWSIIARAWRSASKRAMTCLVSMPGLMIFRATLRRTGCDLLGDVDDAHAPLADLLHQLVGADDRARALREARRFDRERRRRRGGLEEAARLGIEGEEPLDAAPQLGIAAGLVQVGRAGLRPLDLEGRQEDLFDIRSRLVHRITPRSPHVPSYRAMRKTRPARFTARSDFRRFSCGSPSPRSSSSSQTLA